MQTYFLNIIPSLARFSKKLDDITLLTSKHWVILNENTQIKSTYIFRNNKELIVSENGIVVHGTWDYLSFNKILLRFNDNSFLFQHGFLEDDILALKLDGMNKYAIFINEERSDLNTLSRIDSHLNRKYLSAIEVTEKDTTMEIWDVIAYLMILVMLATLAVVLLAT
jgi:hypothetical protein